MGFAEEAFTFLSGVVAGETVFTGVGIEADIIGAAEILGDSSEVSGLLEDIGTGAKVAKQGLKIAAPAIDAAFESKDIKEFGGKASKNYLNEGLGFVSDLTSTKVP